MFESDEVESPRCMRCKRSGGKLFAGWVFLCQKCIDVETAEWFD